MERNYLFQKIFSAVLAAVTIAGNGIPVTAVDIQESNNTEVVSEIEENTELQNESSVESEFVALGGKITVNAKASGGSGGYTYSYLYKKAEDEKWITAKGYSEETTFSLKPASETVYHICVKVKDENKKVVEKTFNVEVKNTLENTSTVESESVPLGGKIVIKGSATGGSGIYTYSYLYKKAGDEKWITAKGYSEETTFSLKPASETVYNICVKVRDENKIVAEKVFDIEVKNTLVNESTVESETVSLGDKITVNAKASGGSGTYTYSYLYKKADDEKWITAKGDSEETDFSLKPSSETTYNVSVKIKDSNGIISEKTFAVEVKNTLENTSTIESESVPLGGKIVMNGSATGGSGEYMYSYLYKKDGDEKWSTAKGYSTESTYSLKPSKETVYHICIKVKDSKGVIAEKTFSVEVKNTLENTSTVESLNLSLGERIVIKGSASGGIGEYTYSYLYKKAGDEKWTTAKGYSTLSEYSLKPAGETTYSICVRVKDEGKNIAEKVFDVEVKNTLENTSTVESLNVPLGEKIVVSGQATGGSGEYTYLYSYKKDGTAKWITENDYSTDTVFEVNAAAPVIYNVRVKVKDSNGIVAEKIIDVAVENTLENESTVRSDTVSLGDKIVMTGSASGGTAPYTYSYLYKKAGDEKWITAKGYSETDSFSIKPASETTYNVCVKAKDANGVVAEKTFDIEVKNTLENQSAVSADSISLSQQVTVTGKAVGGSGEYTYAYYYKKASDTKWVTGKSYSSQTSFTLKPASVTVYNICVKVKDSNGIIAEKTFDVDVSSSLVNQSRISSYNIPKGGTLTLTGSATGGSGEYTYRYTYKRAVSETWMTAQDFTSANKQDIRFSYEGVYNVCVTIKDSNGLTSSKYFDITVKALTNTSSVSANTLDRGQILTLKASATGGAGSYKYAFQYKNQNLSKWITGKNFSTTSTFKLKVSNLGILNVCIQVKDSSGTIVKRYFNIRIQKTVADEFKETVIPEIIDDTMGDFEKAKAIHDWLVRNVEYDAEGYYSDNIPPTSHTAEGLWQTRKAVCDGYAKSFKLLAEAAGLEVNIVSGTAVNAEGAEPESHAWNQVKVDGKWYNVDVTWDDPIVLNGTEETDNLSYQYFLVPDSVLYKNHTPETEVIVCKTAQPMNKIQSATIDDALENSDTVYYCETDADIGKAFNYYVKKNVKKFTIIYKTNETDDSKIFKTLWSYKPSDVAAGASMGDWIFDGYKKIDVTITNR